MIQRYRSVLVCCCIASSVSASPLLAQDVADRPAEPKKRGIFFLELLDDTLRDFSRLPSKDTFTLLAFGGVVALNGSAMDGPSSARMSSSSLASPFMAGETIGGARLQIAGAAATYAIGRLTGSDRAAAIGGDLLRAQFVTQAITGVVKMSVRRGRPDGTEFSFPSGHSSVSFASATVLQQHLGWKAGIPAYAVASYVAASRIHDKRHYLSDVVFGAAVGIAAGRTVTIGRGDKQFAVAPVAAPGGAGVSFTWLGQQ